MPLPSCLDEHLASSISSQHRARWCRVVEVHEQVTTTRWRHAQAASLDHALNKHIAIEAHRIEQSQPCCLTLDIEYQQLPADMTADDADTVTR